MIIIITIAMQSRYAEFTYIHLPPLRKHRIVLSYIRKCTIMQTILQLRKK